MSGTARNADRGADEQNLHFPKKQDHGRSRTEFQSGHPERTNPHPRTKLLGGLLSVPEAVSGTDLHEVDAVAVPKKF